MITIVIRPGNLYGPYDKFDVEKSKVIPSLIRKVIERQDPVSVWGDGNDLKDFLYIDDFVDAINEIIDKVNNYTVLNIASGKGITIKEVLNIILKIEKVENLKIKFDQSMPTMIPKRLINIEKAKKNINFNPKISLEEGLKKLYLGINLMIITKTPFRISFFGGGTDYPDWYNINGGRVISTTINKYCYISIRHLPPFFNYKYRIRYFKNELCKSLKDIKHPTVRESLRYLKFYKNGIEILHNADLPALSGLGSSSTFTVGLINGLYYLIKKKLVK